MSASFKQRAYDLEYNIAVPAARRLIFDRDEIRYVLLNRILNLEEEESVFLAEESLQDLITLPVTSELLASDLPVERAVVVSGLGVALHLTEPEDFWLLLTDRYAEMKALKDDINEIYAGELEKVSVGECEFLEAVIEYYSTSLAGELLCDSCQVTDPPLYVEDRIARLASFLQPLIPKEGKILEICCGSGMATQALYRLGCNPWSVDIDRCDLCQALKRELMDPRRCFILDARLLPRFFSQQSFDAVLGFMVGLIDVSNWPQWKDILLQASSLARKQLIFTVYSQMEAELIAKALEGAGWDGRIIDNRDSKGIYDQWAFHAIRKG